jgi:hypothetical protein
LAAWLRRQYLPLVSVLQMEIIKPHHLLHRPGRLPRPVYLLQPRPLVFPRDLRQARLAMEGLKASCHQASTNRLQAFHSRTFCQPASRLRHRALDLHNLDKCRQHLFSLPAASLGTAFANDQSSRTNVSQKLSHSSNPGVTSLMSNAIWEHIRTMSLLVGNSPPTLSRGGRRRRS